MSFLIALAMAGLGLILAELGLYLAIRGKSLSTAIPAPGQMQTLGSLWFVLAVFPFFAAAVGFSGAVLGWLAEPAPAAVTFWVVGIGSFLGAVLPGAWGALRLRDPSTDPAGYSVSVVVAALLSLPAFLAIGYFFFVAAGTF